MTTKKATTARRRSKPAAHSTGIGTFVRRIRARMKAIKDAKTKKA